MYSQAEQRISYEEQDMEYYERTCLLSAVQCAVSVSVRRYPAREGQVAGSPPGGAPELPRAHRVFTGDAGVGQDKPVPVPLFRQKAREEISTNSKYDTKLLKGCLRASPRVLRGGSTRSQRS